MFANSFVLVPEALTRVMAPYPPFLRGHHPFSLVCLRSHLGDPDINNVLLLLLLESARSSQTFFFRTLGGTSLFQTRLSFPDLVTELVTSSLELDLVD